MQRVENKRFHKLNSLVYFLQELRIISLQERICAFKFINSYFQGNNEASGPSEFSSGSNSKSHIVVQQHEWKRKLSLTLRGHATVFNGITLRLRCPTKSIDRTRLVWMKDYHYVHLQPHKIEIIPKSGALKIKNTTFSDSGVYTCLCESPYNPFSITPFTCFFPISNLTLKF